MNQRVALQEFCDFVGGGKLKLTKRDYREAGFPAFSAAGQDGFVERPEFERPGVIVSSIGARCGKAFLANNGPWTSLANTYCVLPDTDIADPEFLWYQLNDENSWHRSGTAQPFIKPSDIQRRIVLLPPLGEQRRTVDLLNRAASLKRLAEQAQVKARDVIPALFNRMFGDHADKWPRTSFGDLVRETQLGLVRGASETGEDKPFAYVRMNSITTDGELDLRELKHVDATPDELARFRLQRGDFLFNTRNSRELVGKVAVYDQEGVHLFNNNIMRVRFRPDVEPTFVAAAFATTRVQQELELRKSGTTSVFAIYYKNLRTLPLTLPPFHIQRAFAERVREVDSIRRLAVTAAGKAEKTSAVLMSQLFAD